MILFRPSSSHGPEEKILALKKLLSTVEYENLHENYIQFYKISKNKENSFESRYMFNVFPA